MEDKVSVKYDDNGKVIGAYGFSVDGKFITVPFSVWQQVSIYGLENLSVLNNEITICESAQNIYNVSKKITEAKNYLNETDHKFYGDYEPKDDEDLESIKASRKEARDFIRANQ